MVMPNCSAMLIVVDELSGLDFWYPTRQHFLKLRSRSLCASQNAVFKKWVSHKWVVGYVQRIILLRMMQKETDMRNPHLCRFGICIRKKSAKNIVGKYFGEKNFASLLIK